MTGVFDEHLPLDAIVAYADGEMSMTAYQRAAAHVMRCALCAADVAEQTAASEYVRRAGVPVMPGSLFDALKSIPVAVRTHDGSGGPGQGRGRRFRLGAGALVTGIAVGAVMVAAAADHPVGTRTPELRTDNGAVSRPSPVRYPAALNVLARTSTATK